MSVPYQMRHTLLFPDMTWEYEESLLDLHQLKPSFRYDSAYLLNLPAIKPWEIREKAVPFVVDEWKAAADEIQPLFKERNGKAALPLIVKGLQLYVMLLFWGNGKPAVLYNVPASLSSLRIKPSNIEDRLAFIFEKPSLYHSFVQLGELFIETEKQIMKDMIIAKIKSQRKV